MSREKIYINGILTFGSHCSANFQPIFDCFIPKFKLEYDDLENIKTGCVNTVVFNVHQMKHLKFFFGTPGIWAELFWYQIFWEEVGHIVIQLPPNLA